MKFKKRPVVVEANQWLKQGDHPDDASVQKQDAPGSYYMTEGKVVRCYVHPDVHGAHFCKHCNVVYRNHGWIDTLEGGHIVCPGDWIITGVRGEHYPCKDSIFKETYEQVE